MTIAEESLRKRISTLHRVAVFLVLGTAISTTGAVAQDRSDSGPPRDLVSPPPAEFAAMTTGERFRNYLAGISNLQSVIRAAASAGIAQARGTPKEWGGGGEGYGKRVGNAYAEDAIRSTLQYGISATLHEDNRYFVSGQTGFLQRTKYAITSTLLARHDNGKQSFSFSRISSAAGAAFISREWQPRSATTAGDGALTFGVTMGSDLGFNIFHEFWPDLRGHFRKGATR
jgi:hypothetical protein